MSTPFARLETRLNTAAQARLANAQASINGAVAVTGFFDQRAGDALSYVSGNRPVFQAPESMLGTVLEGDAISISKDDGTPLFDGEISRAEPDGMGWIVLSLQAMN